MACSCMTRRGFLATTAAGSVLSLSGCVGAPPAMVSSYEVEAMGLQAWSELRAQVPLSRETAYRSTLDQVSRRLLVHAGETPEAWEVQVFASPEVNAFALPGRKIGVYEGMFRVARSADHLAAVVGHEIGHLSANHPQERISAEVATDTALQLVGGLLGARNVGNADVITAALGLGAQVGLLLPYSRNQELEADAFGLRAMAGAGYDARQALDLWRRMELEGGARGPEFLATHPAPAARIDAMQQVLATLPA
ncbi:M48 family metallopeptidase [Rhodovulum euryhalinum]|uniref:Peptidase M48-like protein n=1 Tax=Rhodovulum euryhalinum TaxID=35805 RepID=A0A4R2KY75_9RHOB|nr:M48 family metallopeptidase [Rhodovulum euryhalinum]TCO71635.1 peptidase M48-like protein [Rhodovulum euryhalinum]